MKTSAGHFMAKKNSCAVILGTVTGAFPAVIHFFALNSLCYRAEFPGDAPPAVEFLLSLEGLYHRDGKTSIALSAA